MEKVYLFLADGFEEIEGLTVVDLLRRAEIDIKMVSIGTNKTVTGTHGIEINADMMFEEVDFDTADMLVLPGGMPGTTNLQQHEGLVQKLIEFHKAGKMLGAICAAPMVLGQNGILQGKKAVCYPGFEKDLVGAEVGAWNAVQDGNVITSRGLGTAIEFALTIVTHFKGKEKAEELQKSIIYKAI